MKPIRIITALLMMVILGSAFSFATGVDPFLGIGTMITINATVNVLHLTGTISLPRRVALLLDFGSLEWGDGKDNVPGIREVGYYAPKSWLTDVGFPEPIANPASMADYGKLEPTPGFVFAQGGFLKVYGTEGKNKVEFEGQGEPDCQSFNNKYTFVYPGTEAAATGFCRRLNNTDCVFIAKEFDGTNRVIGHPRIRTVAKITGTTGDTRTSQKGFTIEVSCTHELPAPIYEGDISLASESS